MKILFRDVDPFNCWIWIRFADVPSSGEQNYVDGIFDSWYVIGKLGGFNSENLQVHECSDGISWMTYNQEESESALPALMHNIGELEYNGSWSRCWVDLGTSDSFAIDVLINAFRHIDSDIVRIEELRIGGINEDWPIEDPPESIFASSN